MALFKSYKSQLLVNPSIWCVSLEKTAFGVLFLGGSYPWKKVLNFFCLVLVVGKDYHSRESFRRFRVEGVHSLEFHRQQSTCLCLSLLKCRNFFTENLRASQIGRYPKGPWWYRGQKKRFSSHRLLWDEGPILIICVDGTPPVCDNPFTLNAAPWKTQA